MIYLAQTDTTVGFLSDSKEELANAKKRDPKQPFIIALSSLKKLKDQTRVPHKYKNLVRRSKKTTFLYPNKKALRVVKDERHSKFLKRFDFLYSSSANLHNSSFVLDIALEKADLVVIDVENFYETKPSKIIKLSKTRQKNFRKK